MDALTALVHLGGTADAASLLLDTTRRSLRRHVEAGRIRRTARGRYVLPGIDEAIAAASSLSGVAALRSAARIHGWPMAQQPPQPEVAVRADRRLTAAQREDVRILWSWPAEDQRCEGVTTPLRTLLDCARNLPFPEALAIADSALRSGLVRRAEMTEMRVQGAGAGKVRRVLRAADARAANPFESVLRGLCLDAGLDVEPQAAVDVGPMIVHPDLLDVRRRLAIEADSWTHHATRGGHLRDCERYDLLVLAGWTVLRFTWEQVMLHPDEVLAMLRRAARRVVREEVRIPSRRPA